jgi:hypothetical protein
MGNCPPTASQMETVLDAAPAIQPTAVTWAHFGSSTPSVFLNAITDFHTGPGTLKT